MMMINQFLFRQTGSDAERRSVEKALRYTRFGEILFQGQAVSVVVDTMFLNESPTERHHVLELTTSSQTAFVYLVTSNHTHHVLELQLQTDF